MTSSSPGLGRDFRRFWLAARPSGARRRARHLDRHRHRDDLVVDHRRSGTWCRRDSGRFVVPGRGATTGRRGPTRSCKRAVDHGDHPFDQVVGVASFASCASTCRVSRFGRWSRPNRCWVQWSRVAHGRRGSGRARSHRRRRHHRGGKRSCVANLAAAAVELVSWAMLVLALRHLDDALAERSRTSVT